MKAIVCEMCGSQNVIKKDGVYVCENCGTKYEIEDARKLLVEIDNSKEVSNLFVLARRAKQENNYSEAYKYYSEALKSDTNNWEAVFYTAYCGAMDCKVGEITYSLKLMQNNMSTTAEVLLNEVDISVRQEAVASIILDTKVMCEFFRSVAKSHYDEFVSTNDASFKLEIRQQYIDSVTAVGMLYIACGMFIGEVDSRSGNSNKDGIVDCYKSAISSLAQVSPLTKNGLQSTVDKTAAMIRKYEPSYQAPTVGKMGACYIATAVYGSYDCPEVWTLRRYRDSSLSSTAYGRIFIKAYYSISPTLVKMFGNKKWFNRTWKYWLDRMVKKLNNNGIPDTPYNDK